VVRLRAVNWNIFKNSSVADVRQAPASAGIVKAYRASGIVDIGTTVLVTPVAVTVLTGGMIEVGDTVWLNGDSTLTMTCTAVSSTTVTLNSTTGSSIPVVSLDRLVPTTTRPVLYQDPFADTEVTPTNSQIVLDSSGEGVFYCAEAVVDCQISGTGLTTEWVWDVDCGADDSGYPTINVNEFLDEDDPIQAAIDTVPAGGARVVVPMGTWTRSTPLYLPCDRPMILEGELGTDGFTGGNNYGTRILNTANTNGILVRGNFQEVKNLLYQNTSGGAAAAEKSGFGIRIGRRDVVDPHPHPGTSATDTEYTKGATGAQRNVRLENTVVINAPGWGLYIPGAGNQSDGATAEEEAIAASTISFWVDLDRVYIHQSKKYGACFVGANNTTITMSACKFMHQGCDDGGSASNFDSYYLYNGGAQNLTLTNNTTFEGLSPDTYPWVVHRDAQNTVMDNCWFEDDRTNASSKDPTYFVDMVGTNRGGYFGKNFFVRGSGCNGYMRIFRANGTAFENFVFGPNFGLSGSATHSANAYPNGTYSPDLAMFDIAAGSARWITVESQGYYYDSARTTHYPFYWDNLASGSVSGHFADSWRMPGGSGKPTGVMGVQNGAVYMDWAYQGVASLGQLLYYWGGTNPGYRQVNNVPLMTTAQRNAGTFIAGDLAWITDGSGPRLEMCSVSGSPGTWLPT